MASIAIDVQPCNNPHGFLTSLTESQQISPVKNRAIRTVKMQHDIIIIGAGPAGLSFARSLADTGLRIVLIEKSPKNTLENPPYDGREIALTHLSHKIMNELGMWQLIPEDEKFRIRDAKVLNGNSTYSLDFNHAEAGKENLGFMVSNNVIRRVAYQSLAGFENVTILDQSEVKHVGTNTQRAWAELADGTTLEAPLMIAADSRFSNSRRMMGIQTSMLDFGRTCVVCTMDAEMPHDDTAVECFHYDRTLAVLPLNNNRVSVVVTLKSENADDVLGQDNAAFGAEIASRVDGKLGEMSLTSELFTYPLVATFAKTFFKPRFALIGDAAVGMHPVTAHGFNLGLQGADTLASGIRAAISRGMDFSDAGVLERYSAQHRRVCSPIFHGTNALVRLYTTDTPPARFARDALLHLGNAFRPARNLIMERLTEAKAAQNGR